jgi:uncharacterized membrane protein
MISGMTTDAWLAIAHHLAVYGLLAVLAMEWALVRPGCRPATWSLPRIPVAAALMARGIGT